MHAGRSINSLQRFFLSVTELQIVTGYGCPFCIIEINKFKASRRRRSTADCKKVDYEVATLKKGAEGIIVEIAGFGMVHRRSKFARP